MGQGDILWGGERLQKFVKGPGGYPPYVSFLFKGDSKH